MKNLGRLEEIEDLRTVWPNEAADFTPWLSQEDNITLLSDTVGFDITVEETESSVGDFHADIFAHETDTDRKIIIENQLGDTNHEHLGKLITYASGKSADLVIWVVKHAREEHKAAIEWLNNHTDEAVGFFLCEIKLYRIDGSEPAVKFEAIETPNGWAKEVRKSDFPSGIGKKRYVYWTEFQNYAFRNTGFARAFRQRKPSADQWMDFSIGSSACYISVSQLWERSGINVAFYIPNNKELYRRLLEHRDEIESAAGMSYSWHELPQRKASKILIERPARLEDQDSWTEQFDWLIDVMLRMKQAFKPYI